MPSGKPLSTSRAPDTSPSSPAAAFPDVCTCRGCLAAGRRLSEPFPSVLLLASAEVPVGRILARSCQPCCSADDAILKKINVHINSENPLEYTIFYSCTLLAYNLVVIVFMLSDFVHVHVVFIQNKID